MEEQNKQLEDIKDQYAKNLKDQFEKECKFKYNNIYIIYI